MDQEISGLLQNCEKKPGASPDLLRRMTTELRVHIPSDYLGMLLFSNGAEGWIGDNYAQLWSAEDVLQYGVYEHAPLLLFIGCNGGGEGFAYDGRLAGTPIVNVPFIGIDEEPRVLGRTIVEFLRRLEAAPLF